MVLVRWVLLVRRKIDDRETARIAATMTGE
jgi:hypothetical protein